MPEINIISMAGMKLEKFIKTGANVASCYSVCFSEVKIALAYRSVNLGINAPTLSDG